MKETIIPMTTRPKRSAAATMTAQATHACTAHAGIPKHTAETSSATRMRNAAAWTAKTIHCAMLSLRSQTD